MQEAAHTPSKKSAYDAKRRRTRRSPAIRHLHGPLSVPASLYPIVLQLWVPVEDTPRVKGAQASLEDQCQCKLVFQPTDEGPWSHITVEGNAACCSQLVAKLEDLVEELDDCVLEFRTLSSRLRFLADSAPEIGADTGVRVFVPSADSAGNVVQVEGVLDSVFDAFYKFHAVIHHHGCQFQTAVLPVLPSKLGLLIGHLGKTMKEITAKSNSKLVFSDKEADESKGEFCKAVISGQADCVLLATEIVKRMLEGSKLTDALAEMNATLGLVIGYESILSRKQANKQHKGNSRKHPKRGNKNSRGKGRGRGNARGQGNAKANSSKSRKSSKGRGRGRGK